MRFLSTSLSFRLFHASSMLRQIPMDATKQSLRQELSENSSSVHEDKRLFYIPSSKIYGGVDGLVDYLTLGCVVKSNVISFWKEHFILEEKMVGLDCSCITPDVVLKASGHVDNFTVIMVKDEKTGTCYRADNLLKDYCNEKLEKDLTITAEKAAELKDVLAILEDFSTEELGAKIREYGITAPDTKNPLSDSYPFNLMFQTSIGPSGLIPGYMRPETAQGIFVNFKDLYYENGRKLPFAAAQIGQAFRNEISPRQGPLGTCEFTLAEIEHFVDPENKSHPKFSDVAKLEFLMFPREEQMSGQSAKILCLGEAVNKGIVNDETLGYFIGRIYLFLVCLGIDKKRLRFRQHLANEMAHYAADCWDAEIESSYGWIKCAWIADRSTYDLRAHSEKSGVALVAEEKYAEPREVEKLVITPVKKELGLAFKGNQKNVVEALEAMNEQEAMKMKAALESKGEVEFTVCALGKNVTIKKSMLSISKEKKKEHQRVFTPSVIGSSFRIDRIIYCLYEHCFRPSKTGDEQLNVFRVPPLTVFTPVQNQQFEEVISKEFTSDATEQSLRQALSEKLSSVEAQGNAVCALKASKAAKAEIDAAIELLNNLKLEKSAVEKQLQSAISGGSGTGALNREAFRQAVVNTLERRLFYIPSFKIYGGVAGFFDYGPPGCAIKSNVLSFWRQHFIYEEKMQVVDCSCITPEAVLKASGHVDKFTDLMVKDEKTGTCYRADHLLKDYCNEKLEKDLTKTAEKAAELKDVLAILEDLSTEELGAKIKEYEISAPDTKNPLSDPYPFNLMFQTSIGPSGLNPCYMRPETAQGIFVNFEDLYDYPRIKLPFAAAQIGQAFRNEISPRQGLLRVREFTLAEIEHFVDPENKSHPKFSQVAKLEFLMFSREEQMSSQSAKILCLGEAVDKGIVNNETLGYFIGRVYLFLIRLGIDKRRLRFRQHLANEMAHYAADCWDAEIECSYGWIECVGIADRSAYDLRAHSENSGVALVAEEKFAEPREVEKLAITPVKKELSLAFKGNQKNVVEALEAMNEQEAMEMKAALESKGEVEFTVCTLGKNVTIKKSMVSISKEKKKEHQRVFTPSVIEPSFGIGRIIYCLYEHCFSTRPSKAGDQQLNVFRFPPHVAPIKCTIFPLVQNQQLEEAAKVISKELDSVKISHKIDITGTSIGKRYARTDELGVPFAITVDSSTSVTIRERDSKDQIRVSLEDATTVVRSLVNGKRTWQDVWATFPHHSSGGADE